MNRHPRLRSRCLLHPSPAPGLQPLLFMTLLMELPLSALPAWANRIWALLKGTSKPYYGHDWLSAYLLCIWRGRITYSALLVAGSNVTASFNYHSNITMFSQDRNWTAIPDKVHMYKKTYSAQRTVPSVAASLWWKSCVRWKVRDTKYKGHSGLKLSSISCNVAPLRRFQSLQH